MEQHWWTSKALLPFKTPTTIVVCGPSQSGKSTFIHRLLSEASGMFDQTTKQVLYCYQEWQPIYTNLEQSIDNLTMHKGMPSKESLETLARNNNEHSVIVLDDMQMSVMNSEDMQYLVTVLVHHYNMTAIILLQNLFPRGKVARDISLNAHYVVLMANKRSVSQVKTFAHQIQGNASSIMSAFHKATSLSYGYLLVDLNPHTDKKYQLRTKIFIGEDTIVYK
jgi:hypothetical protein